jgi:hypothetical protein
VENVMKLRHGIAAAVFFLGLPSIASAANEVVLHRDPGCGCCEKWAQMVRAKFGRNVVVRDDRARAEFRRRAGVPANIASCHTAIIDGLVFEGHVPVADMQRLLRTRPAGAKGLAVAGMPMGSDGMEAPGARQPYDVIAFGPSGTRVFTRH